MQLLFSKLDIQNDKDTNRSSCSKKHPQEHQSFIDRSNQSLLVDHPPIIFDSLETGDHWDHNYENQFDEEDDDDEFVEDLLELDIPAQDTQYTCDIVINNYVYEPPPQGSQCCSLNEFDFFSTRESNTYFWMNLAAKVDGCGDFGGLRGIAWRTIHQQGIYDTSHLATLNDTILLFSFMDHMIESPHRLKHGFMRCIRHLLRRVDRLNVKVEVPTNMKTARSILLEGSYGMFGNIPHPAVHERDGHACISLKDLLKHVCAMKVPIAFTESPNSDGSANPIRITTEIHGSKAMSDLLQKLKQRTGGKRGVYYGYMIFWSDGFLTSWVKQKDNSVWILTITFPDPAGDSTSPFHTYCLAVGPSKLGHSSVIEYYMKEVEEIMQGFDVFFGEDNEVKTLSLGIIAYLADRPERSSILQTAHLGLYGKRSLWTGYIDTKNYLIASHASMMKLNHYFKTNSEFLTFLPVGDVDNGIWVQAEYLW